MKSSELSLKEFIDLCQQLSALLVSGVSLKSSLGILIQESGSGSKHRALTAFQDHLVHGASFFQCFSVILPRSVPLYLADLHQPPHLVHFLQALSTYYSQKLDALNRLYAKLAYPGFLLISLLGLCAILGGWMMPLYAQFFTGMNQEIPAVIRTCLDVRNALSHPLVVWSLIACIVGIIFSRHRLYQQLFAFLFPYTAADTLWLISIFLSSGFSLKHTLDVIQFPVSHPIFNRYHLFYKECLETGHFSSAFNFHFRLRPFDAERLKLAETSSQFSERLLDISRSIQNSYDHQLSRYLSWVQPLLLGILALLIGGCMWMTFTPALSALSTL
jgi:type IV pilus assembly protein PilC